MPTLMEVRPRDRDGSLIKRGGRLGPVVRIQVARRLVRVSERRCCFMMRLFRVLPSGDARVSRVTATRLLLHCDGASSCE